MWGGGGSVYKNSYLVNMHLVMIIQQFFFFQFIIIEISVEGVTRLGITTCTGILVLVIIVLKLAACGVDPSKE